jgi:hypothetical protein
MKLKKIRYSLIILFLLMSSATHISAQERSQEFYIMHYSSGKFIHPYGGSIGKGVDLVLYDGCKEEASFYIEYVEADWGYLVCKNDPNLVIHPEGTSTTAGNGTKLSYWTGRLPGTLFRIDQSTKTIQHISGRYWHPRGGAGVPANNTGIVLWDGYNTDKQFMAVDRYGKTITLNPPVKTSTRWVQIDAFTNESESMATKSYEIIVGKMTSKSTTSEYQATISTSIEASWSCVTASASAEYSSLYSQTTENQSSSGKVETFTYEVAPGQSVYVWQKELVAEWGSGAVYRMGTSKTQLTSVDKAPVD